MDYSTLTETQRNQVDYLFADELIGSDPNDYDYELIGETVTGRVRFAKDDRGLNKRKSHNVVVNIGVRNRFVTVERQRDVELTIKELAYRIVENLKHLWK